MSNYINIPSSGSANWKDPVSTAAALPANGNSLGDARVAQDTSIIYVWSGSAWVAAGGGGGGGVTSVNTLTGALTLVDAGTDGITITSVGTTLTVSQHVADASHNGYLTSTDWSTFNSKQATITIGALDAQAENANGLALVSNVLSAQSADATHPGMVNTMAQTLAGAKTFSTAPILSSLTASTALILDGSKNISTSVNIPIASIGITIDGGGVAPTIGVKGYMYVPYACTINSVTMLADQTGSCVIDIWKIAYASFPPLVGNSITTGGTAPTLSSAQKSQDTSLSGWASVSIAAGDTLAFNVNSASTLTRVSLILKVTKT